MKKFYVAVSVHLVDHFGQKTPSDEMILCWSF